ncbi:hypothetical protein L1887_47725 [Cichorium endivia]|nr:hypothetical protein L1887_47725 [Cichorium endivia]
MFGRGLQLTDGRVGDAAVTHEDESEHQHRCSRSNAHQRERASHTQRKGQLLVTFHKPDPDPGLLCNAAVIDGEAGLGRVDVMATSGDGSRELLAARGDNVVARIGVLGETPLLLEGVESSYRTMVMMVERSEEVRWGRAISRTAESGAGRDERANRDHQQCQLGGIEERGNGQAPRTPDAAEPNKKVVTHYTKSHGKA